MGRHSAVMNLCSSFSLLIGFSLVRTAVAADYPVTVLQDAPLVYYRFSDLPAADTAWNSGSAGAAVQGLYTGTVTHLEPGAVVASGRVAAKFEGTGGRVAAPFHAALNPPAATPFTIEAWVKPTIEGAGNAQCPLFNRHSDGNRQGWVFFQRPSAQGFNFRMYNGAGSAQSVDITGG